MQYHLEDDPRRSEIVLRRMARFFGTGGLCEAYERRRDQLVQFHDIANLVTDMVPTVSREAVVRRFLFSTKTDWFGQHGPRQTIEQLIDLDCSFAPRGRYSLRPSYIRVEACPEYMRARRSVWARWFKALGWPVPPELEAVPASSPEAGDHGAPSTRKGEAIRYTGLPGRPTSWHLIEAECRRRFSEGERRPNWNTGSESSAAWARVLCAWLRCQQPNAPTPTEKTVTNKLAALLRELGAAPRPTSRK